MDLLILGGGLAGLTTALFAQERSDVDNIIILEKESEVGGLCRSFDFDGRKVDIGPHIIFSRDSEVLDFMVDILGDNKEKHRRNNFIPHGKSMIHYPFENNLSALPKDDCEYCLQTFLNNPYRDYEASNMLQFFLKVFGEGITDFYLRPYNEKIWKFNPAFMNTQMVERIPRPPDDDIINSANGKMSEGHLHQLYFTYPKTGGIAALIKGIIDRFNSKVKIFTNYEVNGLSHKNGKWNVSSGGETFSGDIIVSCMPIDKLVDSIANVPIEIYDAVRKLRYNDIAIALAKVRYDRIRDIHTLTIADKDVVFHRLSKPDFMGGEYKGLDSVVYMMEYTYRRSDKFIEGSLSDVKLRFGEGLVHLGLIDNMTDILDFAVHKFPYAYVIYDLHHTKHMGLLRSYFNRKGIFLNGRFGNFEYWNMDKVIKESRKLVDRLMTKD